MNKIIVAIALLVSTISFSQEKIERELGSFDEIKVFNGLNITLSKSSKASVKITGKKADEVILKNVNGRLKLSMRFPETFSSKDAEVTIYYSDDISVIDVNEGSYVSSENTINQKHIELKVQEGAIIDLELDVEYLDSKSVTGGTIIVSGKAGYQTVEVTTGGNYKAYDLQSNHSTIVASSGALARVTVSDFLDAKVRFGGTVYYKGNPKEVKSKKIIGGTIKSKD
ncbi:MAG: DUF2807 domain-containing protein [Lutibacter sp.]|nr:MAG: DUF2807 domain-containing protein [Lutibacter sp.]